MSRSLPCWVLVGVSLGLGACDSSTETPADAPVTGQTAPAQQDTPAPPPLPKPLMRQAMHCCKNLTMEPVLRAYLDLGEALADQDEAAATTAVATLREKLAASNLKPEKLAPLQQALAPLDPAALAPARQAYAAVSEQLVETLESSQAGALDLAIAYSRRADAHWFQQGVEPKSPYGDGINSYSWGTRDEVKAADEVREQELGHRP